MNTTATTPQDMATRLRYRLMVGRTEVCYYSALDSCIHIMTRGQTLEVFLDAAREALNVARFDYSAITYLADGEYIYIDIKL